MIDIDMRFADGRETKEFTSIADAFDWAAGKGFEADEAGWVDADGTGFTQWRFFYLASDAPGKPSATLQVQGTTPGEAEQFVCEDAGEWEMEFTIHLPTGNEVTCKTLNKAAEWAWNNQFQPSEKGFRKFDENCMEWDLESKNGGQPALLRVWDPTEGKAERFVKNWERGE